MIFGTDNHKGIYGMEKILSINPKFVWNDVRYIERFDYTMEMNEYYEQISNLKILFWVELQDKKMQRLCVKFNEINSLKINNMGGKYNQIMGFEIIDKSTLGWEQDLRYMIRDYENGTIEFYCKTIEIV